MPMIVPMIRMISRPISPSLMFVPAKPEAMPVAKGLTVEPEHADPGAQQDQRAGCQPVVAGRQHHRDDQGIEGQRLFSHAVGGAADGEDGHQDGEHPFLFALQLAHHPGDPGVDGAGLHRHAQEAADDEHEHGDVDGAEQLAVVPHIHVAGLVLDAVHAVDRSFESAFEQLLRVGSHRMVGARDRRAILVIVIRAGRDDPGGERDQDQQDEQNGESGWEGELLFGPCFSHGSILLLSILVFTDDL